MADALRVAASVPGAVLLTRAQNHSRAMPQSSTSGTESSCGIPVDESEGELVKSESAGCVCRKRVGTLLVHPSFDMNCGLYFVSTARPCDSAVFTPFWGTQFNEYLGLYLCR
jgi:hypothetical protein